MYQKPIHHLSLQIKMEENTSSPDEINRNKKRKQLETPIPHLICCNPSPDSSKKAKKLENDQNFVRDDDQSDLESAKDSNSIPINDDSMVMSTDEDDEANTTDLEYPEICSALAESSTSSVCWSDTTSSSDKSLYSSEGTKSSYDNKLPIDCRCSECKNHGIEEFEEKGLEDLLYSNGVAPVDYVLSSGRWTVDRGSHGQDGKKLTIDKDFEQYFSMLVL